MRKHKCLQCGNETVLGDVRSGMVSFGSFFVEYAEAGKGHFGAPKLKPGAHRNNRVVSYACRRCGYISSYLEAVIDPAGTT